MTESNLWFQTLNGKTRVSNESINEQYDVVIIGAGFTGLSAALHLAKTGVKVCVLEANSIGYGGSGRNVGLVNAGLWTPPEEVERILGKTEGAHLNKTLADGPDTVFNLIERFNINCEATRKGTLHCAETASQISDLCSRFKQQQQRNAPVKLLDQNETSQRIGSSLYKASLWDGRAGTIQPLAYVRGLAAAAISKGAQIFEQTAALSLIYSHSKWYVNTSKGNIRAHKLIQATNAYGVQGLFQNAFIPMRFMQLATPQIEQNILKSILINGEGIWDNSKIMTSVRLSSDSRLLIGSFGNLDSLASGIHKSWAKRKLGLIFPQLNEIKFEYGWTGKIAMTSDHLPKVKRIGHNAISIYGFNGRGISPGTVFGKSCVDWVIKDDEQCFPVQLCDEHIENWHVSKSYFYGFGVTLSHLVNNRV